MPESKRYLLPEDIKRRSKQLMRGNGQPEVAEGARLQYRGYRYISRVQRIISRGVTAYIADHQLVTSDLWDRGMPKEIFKRTYSLAANDQGRRIVLEVSEIEDLSTYDKPIGYEFEDVEFELGEHHTLEDYGEKFVDIDPSPSEWNLTTGRMVFNSESTPPEEIARMARLFKL